MSGMSISASSPDRPPADETLVREDTPELRGVAARHGITALRYASPGRLVGRVDPDRDSLDAAAFDIEATELLGAVVMLFSDRVLSKPNVSPDLVAAQSL